MSRQFSNERGWKLLRTGDLAFDEGYSAWTPAPEKAEPLLTAAVRRSYDRLFAQFPGVSLSVYGREVVLVHAPLIRQAPPLLAFVLGSVDCVQSLLGGVSS
ncbi:MAG: hypothetical protein HY293_00850 [Planctomycetes bacterium]|nr:hypothetical protein [Planctomycetota bacterium]